jgi:archaellum component FlaC
MSNFCEEHIRQMDKVNKLDSNMVELRTDMKYVKEDVTEIKEKLNSFIDSAPHKFASKEEHLSLRTEVNLLKKEMKDVQILNAKIMTGVLLGYLALNIILKIAGWL